ncbi:uncharacterized protein V1513DRAFT_444453 [Lipomyces chichibuensis]|uniref:uncharacterized protein n=1 Tax=Lipomyces chichibuensis TaxID=1546026 RepID=UPI003342EDC5
MTESKQSIAARLLLRSGVSLQLFGLVWGLIIPLTPFPKLGLTAHIQSMAQGTMVLGAGLLLEQPNLLNLSALELKIVSWGFCLVWASIAAQCFNAFWGTNQILPIAAAAAGATGAEPWKEQIITQTLHIAGFGLMGSFAVLVRALFKEQNAKKTN